MNLKLIDYLVCPQCGKGALREEDPAQSCGAHGEEPADLRCGECAAGFPIVSGIPRFVPNEGYSNSFGFQWNLHRRTQLDSFSGLPISRQRLFGVTGWPETLQGTTILEAGCGAGRFTEILLTTGADVVSFDYSTAVEANHANNGENASLSIFQADIFNIPLRQASFDKVLCLGVLQHTPDPERAFRSLAKHVRPGGELVIDVYASRLRSLLHWKYLLRPLTRRMSKERLYQFTENVVSALLPLTGWLQKHAGRAGARLMPIVEYSRLGLPAELNKQWSILDTFDMYSPAHDHPQSIGTVRRWFQQAGFEDIAVDYGPNGIVGKGRCR
jgi:SAM-dependent methyltransferase